MIIIQFYQFNKFYKSLYASYLKHFVNLKSRIFFWKYYCCFLIDSSCIATYYAFRSLIYLFTNSSESEYILNLLWNGREIPKDGSISKSTLLQKDSIVVVSILLYFKYLCANKFSYRNIKNLYIYFFSLKIFILIVKVKIFKIISKKICINYIIILKTFFNFLFIKFNNDNQKKIKIILIISFKYCIWWIKIIYKITKIIFFWTFII